MSAEECQGYACPPSTTVNLPECPGGWEIGNNTAVCATQQPLPAQLPATGGELDLFAGFLGISLAIVGTAGLIGAWRIRRAERRIPEEAAEAQRQALAEVDAMMGRAGAQVARKLNHDLGER